MKVSITRRYEFSAAHQLHGLPDGHKCSRIHGHNYALEITMEPTKAFPAKNMTEWPDPPLPLVNGMVHEAGNLDISVRPVLAKIDHHFLNELPQATNEWEPMRSQPTAENIAIWLWHRLAFLRSEDYRMSQIRLFENDRLWVDISG